MPLDTDVSQMTFKSGFEPKNVKIVLAKGSKFIIAFDQKYNGRDWYNIREIYEQYGEWCPGKGGFMIPQERKNEFLQGLKQLCIEELPVTAAA